MIVRTVLTVLLAWFLLSLLFAWCWSRLPRGDR